MDPIVQFLGRLHPMILHAPIGLAIGLASVELTAWMWAKPGGGTADANRNTEASLLRVRSVLAWLLALSAVASVATGLILHKEGGYREPEVDLHQWLAIAAGVLALAAAVSQQIQRTKLYAACLALMCGVLIPAGHYGATLTHGRDFLTEPFQASRAGKPITPGVSGTGSADTKPAASTVYASTIQPIFDRSCVSCHGTERKKGGLALHNSDAMLAGGDSGPAIIAGDAAGSDLVRRLRLPITDDEHMPPKSKPQLSEEEIKAIEDWINAGASLTALAPIGEAQTAEATQKEVRSDAPPQPDESALRALESAFVHAKPVKPGSPLLVVSAAAVAGTVDDATADRLLRPVAESIVDLDLSRSKITDRTLMLVAQMPRLRRLNLSATSVTDAGIAALAAHPALEELVLSATGATTGIQPTLAGLRSLKSVYVWKTGITPEAAASLRAALPGVTVNAGDALTTAIIETELVVALTGDAPPATAPTPSAPTAADASALSPSNALCPVSGKPVDPGFAIVYNNKVVGFCCKHCLAQFLDEPEKYAASIK